MPLRLGHQRISIHSPRMGRDRARLHHAGRVRISIHSPRMGRDLMALSSVVPRLYFNPLSPHGERRGHAGKIRTDRYFNPLSPHGERPLVQLGQIAVIGFQSTLPAWGETMPRPAETGYGQHFNPLSPHGERPSGANDPLCAGYFNPLSPHGERHGRLCSRQERLYFNPLSPHGERRAPARIPRTSSSYFNPLSPHGERRVSTYALAAASVVFQSTLPAWGETIKLAQTAMALLFQSTLPAWGETQSGRGDRRDTVYFNPLSPHGERPAPDQLAQMRMGQFQSTLPAWGETPCGSHGEGGGRISIHSPRMGRDDVLQKRNGEARYFNPLSPHGERPPSSAPCSRVSRYFNPLSPHGERLNALHRGII